MPQIVNTWDSGLYDDKHSFVYHYGSSLIELLDPQMDERILDVGCGSGVLTEEIRKRAGEVIGMDASLGMIQKARSSFPHCDFRVGDAADFLFKTPFDAIFSNATLHWVTDYRKAVQCMFGNLKKGGRLVAEFGGKDNVKAITDALRDALKTRGYRKQARLKLWYFPSIGDYSSVLEAVGFRVTFARWYDRPTELDDKQNGIIDWLDMFAKPFFTGVTEEHVEEIKQGVQQNLGRDLFRNGSWYADYKRIRIIAVREK
ncbi:methyltransferase domain-containing protein [Flavobacteriaceae bacterium TP-CH-4]|uniref:Methyltransferase domain-containing protein n=1 Tax=Pelagihabitans pacificus TaxID=2696054 RepID=A0A967E6Y8_9FLAO|nr:class I SAM-dependent methyltransferase [Pelagihabitans pacificus]NHF60120.1 methyltransferase domain-containing protein [Pelagihabitans pacificus]